MIEARAPIHKTHLRINCLEQCTEHYQTEGVLEEIRFPAGATWVVYTDQVPHAALAGRHALEQTFHIGVSKMKHPERSPLWVLEGLAGRRLA